MRNELWAMFSFIYKFAFMRYAGADTSHLIPSFMQWVEAQS